MRKGAQDYHSDPVCSGSEMAPRRRLVLLFLTLAGCAGAPSRTPPPLIDDPALTVALNGLLCRVESDCAKLRLQIVDRPYEQAEMFPDGRLLVNVGLLLATRDESEIAFVLAHETAHRRLGHRIAISSETRTRLELEADADAQRAMSESGLRVGAGLQLLQRLLVQARETPSQPTDDAGKVSARDIGRTKLKEAALSQIEARIDALRALDSRSILTTLPVTTDWQRLLAPYRRDTGQIKADAPASPPSQSPPSGL